MRVRSFILLALAFISFHTAKAQYTQVGIGGFTSSSGPLRGVLATPFYNRHAYIYPAQTISGLKHGDTIRSIEFKRFGFDSLQGNCKLQIYLKNVSKSDFGPDSLNMVAEQRDSGLTLVYDNNPKSAIGTKHGFIRFDFTEVDYYVFDTTGNAVNLELLVYYEQRANQNSRIDWFVESSYTVPGLLSVYEGKYMEGGSSQWDDSMSLRSNMFKPTVRFNHPQYATELEVRDVYALGTCPVRMERADTVKAIVKNIGKDTVKGHQLYLDVSGANSYQDTITLPDLAPQQEIFAKFSDYLPVNQGTETLKVKLALDSDSSNNQGQRQRIVGYNVFSHKDPFASNNGGIGLDTTGDMVAKFYVDGTEYLNQIKVDFFLPNREFQLVVWEDDGPNGLPGTIVYISDTLLTTRGTFVLPVLPKAQVTGDFYIGVRQPSMDLVSFSFHYERPLRPHVFFFKAPISDSVWLDFYPRFEFNFVISPRIQVHNDLAIKRIVAPSPDTMISYDAVDSITPMVEVVNYGLLTQNYVKVDLEIFNIYNQRVYTSSQFVSLTADSSTILSFDKFSKYNLGEFTIKASVDLNVDSVKENNSLASKFTLFKRHDVAPDIMYEPNQGDTFDLTTGFWPQVRLFNYGISDQTSIPVTARLTQDDSIFSRQTLYIDLKGGESVIMTFDSVYVLQDGWQTFEVYSDLFRDSFPSNDTLAVMIYGRTNDDVGIYSIKRPADQEKFATSSRFRPFITHQNTGFNPQDSIMVRVKIYDEQGRMVYTDSLLTDLLQHSINQAVFERFYTPDTPAKFTFVASSFIPNDEKRSNDSMVHAFEVVEGRDLVVLGIDTPDHMQVFEVGATATVPSFRLFNNGLVDAGAVDILLRVSKGQVIYAADTVHIDTILRGETLNLTGKPLNFNEGGEFLLEVINLWTDEDELTRTDTARVSYVVKHKQDLALSNPRMPSEGQALDVYVQYQPEVTVSNLGIDSSNARSLVLEIVEDQQSMSFRDTLHIDRMPVGSQVVLNSGRTFSASQLGGYSLSWFLLGSDDQTANDSLGLGFEVVKNFDVSVDSSRFPSDGTDLRYRTTYKPAVKVSNRGSKALDSTIVLRCMVTVGDTNKLIYSHERSIALDSGESLWVEFDSSLRYPSMTQARVVFSTQHPNDLEKGNDSLYFGFWFTDGAAVQRLTAGLRLYPNPFSNGFRVMAGERIDHIQLFNGLGQLVYEAEPRSSQHDVMFEGPAGVYTIQWYASGVKRSAKVIRE